MALLTRKHSDFTTLTPGAQISIVFFQRHAREMRRFAAKWEMGFVFEHGADHWRKRVSGGCHFLLEPSILKNRSRFGYTS
jgi:hypothetical protein